MKILFNLENTFNSADIPHFQKDFNHFPVILPLTLDIYYLSQVEAIKI